jgi:GGDEF domain-containing protein
MRRRQSLRERETHTEDETERTPRPVLVDKEFQGLRIGRISFCRVSEEEIPNRTGLPGRAANHLAVLSILQAKMRHRISIGKSIYPFDAADSETLLKKAYASMYRAKGSGRNDFSLRTFGTQ